MAKHLTTAELSTLLTPTFAAAKTISGVAAASSVVTVTATGHGFSVGDVVAQYGIGGATEANGPFIVATVPTANTYTLTGITAVTNYTSGGSAKKVTAGLLNQLKPSDLDDLTDALKRIYHVKGTDSDRSAESTLLSLLTAAG
jgi:hypothetical protein